MMHPRRLSGTAGNIARGHGLRLVERDDLLVEGARGALVHVEQQVAHAEHHLADIVAALKEAEGATKLGSAELECGQW